MLAVTLPLLCRYLLTRELMNSILMLLVMYSITTDTTYSCPPSHSGYIVFIYYNLHKYYKINLIR